jgi:hypothetical protein
LLACDGLESSLPATGHKRTASKSTMLAALRRSVRYHRRASIESPGACSEALAPTGDRSRAQNMSSVGAGAASRMRSIRAPNGARQPRDRTSVFREKRAAPGRYGCRWMLFRLRRTAFVLRWHRAGSNQPMPNNEQKTEATCGFGLLALPRPAGSPLAGWNRYSPSDLSRRGRPIPGGDTERSLESQGSTGPAARSIDQQFPRRGEHMGFSQRLTKPGGSNARVTRSSIHPDPRRVREPSPRP